MQIIKGAIFAFLEDYSPILIIIALGIGYEILHGKSSIFGGTKQLSKITGELFFGFIVVIGIGFAFATAAIIVWAILHA